MGKVIVDLSVSLDGFIAGADAGMDSPLGVGGERLFHWFSAGPESNRVNQWFCPPDAISIRLFVGSLPVTSGREPGGVKMMCLPPTLTTHSLAL